MYRQSTIIATTASGAFVIAAAIGVAVALHAGSRSPAKTVAAVAGTASSTTPSEADSSTSGIPAATTDVSCTLNESGFNVEVTLNQDRSACTQLAQTLARNFGGYWQLAIQDSNLTLVCAVSKDAVTALVSDTGSHFEGSNLCRGFQADGYVEDLAVEQGYTQAQAAAAASAAQASASAAAAAALASQQSADYQNTTATLASLQETTAQGGNIASDTATLGHDSDQAAKDLAHTKDDAAQGQGQDCYGLVTVYYDAVNTVGYDENSTLSYDLNSLKTDIAAVRSAESNLSADATALQNEGITPPPGIADAIAAAQQANAAAITKANTDIDAVASDVAQAYEIQNAMVTGACSTGDPAGDPPSPPAHLS